MKRVNMKFAVLLLGLFLFVSLVSASTTLSASPKSFNVQPGDSGNIIVSYSIVVGVNGTSGSSGVNLYGSPQYLSYSGSSISYPGNATTNGTFTVSYAIPSNAAAGTVVDSIDVDSTKLNITFNVQQPATCQINPSLTSYTQQVQQGQTFVLPQVTFSPSGCSVSYDSSHIYMEGGIIGSGGLLRPVYISSMGAGYVNLAGDTTGLSSTSYPVYLDVNAGGQTTKIPITIIVSGSSTPVTNVTSAPTCSLNAVEMSLNQTYTFTCSNTNGIKVNVPYSEYYQGVSIDTSTGISTYTFQPIKSGLTNFVAYFTQDGYSVFKQFSQAIKINPRSGSLADGKTKLQFYQGDQRENISELVNGNVTVQVYDNSTGNLIPFSDLDGLYLNGNKLPSNTFEVDYGKSYELTASLINQGYADNTLDFQLTPKPFNFTITPSQDIYFVGEALTFQSGVGNISYSVDGNKITNPYTLSTVGNVLITASKDGYSDSKINLTVDALPTVTSSNEDVWRKGQTIILSLSNSTNWKVYKDGTNIASGTGSTVQFTTTDYGEYDVKVGNALITGQAIQSQGIFGWIGDNFILVLIIAIVVIFLIYTIFFKGKEKKSPGSGDSFGDFPGQGGH